MIRQKTLKLSLKSLRDFAKKRLPDEELIALDERDECPLEIVRHMCSPDKLGIQLLFIPGRVRRLGRRRFRRVLHLRRDGAHRSGGRHFGARHLPGQRSDHGRRDSGAEEDLAHADRRRGHSVRLRRHRAGGGQRSRRAADHGRPRHGGRPLVGYKINGSKQWISNGGIADVYTVLANTPGGPSWFVVEKGAKGFTHDKPEDKHGIRLSNTAALSFNDVYVDADRLVGGVEGQGLMQAQAVFGYTRLMVAAFGLGARMGGARSRDSLLDASASRPARRCRRSRATRTS